MSVDKEMEVLIETSDDVDIEEKPECGMCGDSGNLEHGYWDEETDEFFVTKYTLCECRRD